MILLNFSSTPQTLKWDQTWAPQVCLSTFLDKNQEKFHAPFEVRGDEGLILKQQS